MQFPESWLREFCNPPIDTARLASVLTMAGLEVEEVRTAAPPFTGVVVCEIVAVAPHPSADRLRVCTIRAGAHSGPAGLQIVCGAPNARVGLRAPLALDGAQLPPAPDGAPITITTGLLRGVESAGMLCSARELKLSEDHGGLMELADDAPLGMDLRQHLQLDDALFTLKLTPNLAHCLSVYGVARELAALTGAPLTVPSFPAVPVSHPDRLPVRIEAADLCGRFSGRIVRNIDMQAKTPRWMIDKLARCGQRSVNALVDISNYVMFELGRPSHIFDLDKIDGGLVVRWGQPGERLKLLNGNTVDLDEKVGVIADAHAVESLAGIMGGDATAVSDATRNIYVEAAFWWPWAIAGRSRRYAFSTDAGHRFERGVDPQQTIEHIERITQLVIDICGGQAGPIDDQSPNLPARPAVALRVDRACKVIGMPVTQAQCADVFTRLGLPFTEQPGSLLVSPPSFRFDLNIEEDLIEEVIRIVGYERLPMTPPMAPVVARQRIESQRGAFALRRCLAALDYQETISFSFVEERWEHELAGNPDPIKVLNPIAAPLAVMRSSLMGSLIQVLRNNLAKKLPRVRVFEIGRVAWRDATVVASNTAVDAVRQPVRIGGLAYGSALPLQWADKERAVDFFDVKGDIEALLAPRQLSFVPMEHPALHPGRSARIELGGRPIGIIGELHPRWRQSYELPLAPVLFEMEMEMVLERVVPSFLALSKYQAAWRDLSLVIGASISHDDLIRAVSDDPTGLVKSATLFDVYVPRRMTDGELSAERSVTLRLQIQDPASILTEERIDAARMAAVRRAEQQLGARLRT